MDHNSGPYFFDEENETIMSEEGAMIASVYGFDDFPCADLEQEDVIREECRLNGHVLAAAPMLLSDGQALIDAITKSSDWHSGVMVAVTNLAATIRKAKCEGEFAAVTSKEVVS